jgi:hypothetical protein
MKLKEMLTQVQVFDSDDEIIIDIEESSDDYFMNDIQKHLNIKKDLVVNFF